VKPDLDQPGRPLRTFPAQWVVAGVAILGAIALQIAWLEAGRNSAGAWPLDAALFVAATIYLLATARFHAILARWRPGDCGPRLGILGRGLACDLIISCLSGILLANGHTTPLYRAGLWLVPPILLTACATSAAVEALALRDSRIQFAGGGPRDNARLSSGPHELPRLILAALLILLLFALN
jgi:hypothetical protein